MTGFQTPTHTHTHIYSLIVYSTLLTSCGLREGGGRAWDGNSHRRLHERVRDQKDGIADGCRLWRDCAGKM